MESVKSVSNVTALLSRWQRGEEDAVDALFSAVYDELRRIARGSMRGERSITLQPTVLVHEAYVRLIGQRSVEWNNRAHFFAVALQMMRRIVVDHVRRRQAEKRGGGAVTISLDSSVDAAAAAELDVLGVDEAITDLAAIAPRQARIIELRFFGGLTIEDTARVLDVSPITVKREWRLARAWLLSRLEPR